MEVYWNNMEQYRYLQEQCTSSISHIGQVLREMQMRTISSLEDVFGVLDEYREADAYLRSIYIRMWDLSIRICSDSDEVLDTATSQFMSFLVPEHDSELTIRIHNEEVYVDEALYSKYNGITVGGNTIILGPFCICAIDEKCSFGLAVIRKGSDELHYLASLFRAMAPVIARSRRGILLHSSGIIHDGKVFMFIGQSESGKSTVVRLSEPCVALSDEAIFVYELDGRLHCWGSPYGREHPGSNVREQLGCCLFLVQDTDTYAKKLSVMQALPKLVANLWCITDLNDISSDILSVCIEIARTIPCYELHFELNNRFWDVIDKEFS
jgi:hypothetical protein